jgi:hypothetical protein
MRAGPLSVAILVAVSAVGRAQSPSQAEPPGRVVRSAFAALDAGAFDTLASFVHPAALDTFRVERLRMISRMSDTSGRESPDAHVPPCVAAFYDSVSHGLTARRPAPPSPLALLGVRDTNDLAHLSPAAFFTRWMGAEAALAQRDDSLFWAHLRSGAPSGFPEAPRWRARRTVLGESVSGDTIAYVVYETRLLPPHMDPAFARHAKSVDAATSVQVRTDTTMVFLAPEPGGLHVAVLRRDAAGRWRVMLDGDPFGMALRILEP